VTDVWFIVAAYAVSGASIAGYAAWVLVRGRRLSARVPEEQRRWL
jgi:heme exporter protein CcmD